MLFQIGDTDYTRKIIQGTYTVNSYDVYKEWQDANVNIHRSVLKRRISGVFTMYFGNQTDYQTFLNALETVRKNDGSYTVSIMVNNEHSFKTNIDMFIDFRPTREQKVLGEAWYPELDVSIQGK